VDLLLRDALVVDGSGAPARAADVAVTGDRISAVAPPGELAPSAGAELVALDGLAQSPGFIDVHTHYDAQVLWDPDLTPSSWHGVTSVVMGNCGFGVAPTRPQHRDTVIRTLENVEGMSADALRSGIDWCFETFPEYIGALRDRATRLNVGALVGHSAVRLFVMDGAERPATESEIDAMRTLVRDSVRGGGLGFATSRQPLHNGASGRPVPSRFADVGEVAAIAAVLGELRRGILQVSIGPGLFVDQLSELSTRHRIPVTWTALVARSERPGAALRLVERAAGLPGEVYPQIACRPVVMQMTLADPFSLAEIDVWKEALARPRDERAALYRDAAWRDRARDPTLVAWNHRWHRIAVEETEASPEVVGVPLDEVAVERGTTPFDAMVDLALSDDIRTRFRVVLENDGEEELATLLADRRVILGLSDAGAHASQLCDACYATYLLSYWVRERRALGLEQAVWRLTGHPHRAFRIEDRGLLQEGYFADIVAFDPDTVGCGPARRVNDLPGGADRLTVDSTGIEHAWVNGVAIRRDGLDVAGASPGRVLTTPGRAR
jgi:N-acyl-D-aspartate/D-glutamate deacylase